MPNMPEQKRGIGQTNSIENKDDAETEIFVIETDFEVEDIGLSSNIPHEIDALTIVNNESNILTLVVPHDFVGRTIRKLEELSIGIRSANFDLTLYR